MALDFAKTSAMVIIFAFLWHFLSARVAGTKIGQAMAFIF